MGKLVVLLFCGMLLHSQTEFKEFDNGLIYSPEAIAKLQQVVGEKNDEFRKCEVVKSFVSVPQTKGFFIQLNPRKKRLSGLIDDLKSNILLQGFKSKYKEDLPQNSRLLVKTTFKGYDNKEYIRITDTYENKSIKLESNTWNSSKYGNWVFKKDKDNTIRIFYLENDFKRKILPQKYCKYIQYADCLIDSTTQIYFDGAQRYRMRTLKKNDSSKQKMVFSYIQNEFDTKEPVFQEDPADETTEEAAQNEEIRFDQYLEAYDEWERSRQYFIREKLSHRKEFLLLLEEAYQETIKTSNSTNELESLIANYVSKEKALKLKRNRIVVGRCSQDLSPRIHAMNIAQLSAESYNWDIFLRAHLNVMNDRFQRASDGNYAWKSRKTYLKELEVLNIDVPYLIYGISLRVGNPGKNHYYSNIRRIGRAIAESKDTELINNQLIEMIKDTNLDDYNRLVLFHLYHNFQYNMGETYDKQKIKDIASLLPTYVMPKLK